MRFARVSIADSNVVSVVELIASTLSRDAVSPPEKMGVEPSMMSPPEIVMSRDVVALPEIVKPLTAVPFPIVVEALDIKPPEKVRSDVVAFDGNGS